MISDPLISNLHSSIEILKVYNIYNNEKDSIVLTCKFSHHIGEGNLYRIYPITYKNDTTYIFIKED
jgi:hypothetical protein